MAAKNGKAKKAANRYVKSVARPRDKGYKQRCGVMLNDAEFHKVRKAAVALDLSTIEFVAQAVMVAAEKVNAK